MPFYFITMHLFNPQAQLLFPAVSLQSHNTEQKKKTCLSLVFFFNIPLVEALPLSQVYLSLPSLAQTMVLHTTIAAMRKVDTHRLFVFFFSFSLSLCLIGSRLWAINPREEPPLAVKSPYPSIRVKVCRRLTQTSEQTQVYAISLQRKDFFLFCFTRLFPETDGSSAEMHRCYSTGRRPNGEYNETIQRHLLLNSERVSSGITDRKQVWPLCSWCVWDHRIRLCVWSQFRSEIKGLMRSECAVGSIFISSSCLFPWKKRDVGKLS